MGIKLDLLSACESFVLYTLENSSLKSFCLVVTVQMAVVVVVVAAYNGYFFFFLLKVMS